jgi:hypothetical protein
MAKETKTGKQLQELVMREASASGKCADLESVIVVGPVERGYSNWDIATSPTHPKNTISGACQIELNMIVGRLQAKYNLLAKQRKTARELEDMIAERVGVGGVMVKVHSDPAYGWHATVMTAPAKAIAAQQVVERISEELRLQFELTK